MKHPVRRLLVRLSQAPFLLAPLILSSIILAGCDESTTVTEPTSTAELAFRNSVTDPPSDWKGPLFELSHEYPATLPAGGEDLPWLAIEVDFEDKNPVFEGPWEEYIRSIFAYVTRGQDPNLTNESGFITNIEGQDAWFHVPWMAYNPNAGREYIHGCTSERVASVADLDGNGAQEVFTLMLDLNTQEPPRTTQRFETWAVGMYNEYAGHAIGQAFPSSGKATVIEKNGQTLPAGLPFPVGSAVVKVLFTTATEEDAPFLKGAPTWTVDRHVATSDTTFGCDRAPQTVRLVQMDVAVSDPRSPTRWVFGTFAYNGNLPGATAMERMDPVGIQYGNDPQSCPAVPSAESQPVYQSVLNDSISIYEHNGCGRRLAGPVDNPLASCMSCHAAAFTAPMNTLDKMGTNIPPIFYYESMCQQYDSINMRYFGNRKYPEPYGNPAYAEDIPLDFSLQLLVAFEQYKVYSINGKPDDCKPANVSHDTVDNTCK